MNRSGFNHAHTDFRNHPDPFSNAWPVQAPQHPSDADMERIARWLRSLAEGVDNANADAERAAVKAWNAVCVSRQFPVPHGEGRG